MVVYTAYVHSSVGLGLASRQLVASLLTRAELHGLPLKYGADLQVDPSCFQETPWSLGSPAVACAAPDLACYMPSGAPRVDGIIHRSPLAACARQPQVRVQATSCLARQLSWLCLSASA